MPPAEPSPPPDAVRRLLNQRDLASARHRAAMSRRLGLSDTEMLAVAHLAQHGSLSPSTLGEMLALSSGGVTALVQRLASGRHVVRQRHPTDRRKVLIELSPELVERARAAFGPLVADLDRAASELGDRERAVVHRYLSRVVAVSEAHADRAGRELAPRPTIAPAAPEPGLWG
jgi:DNA-binding MarR family transcriptional regulator